MAERLDLEAVKARHEEMNARYMVREITLDGPAVPRAHTDRAALISEVEALREALRPFARLATLNENVKDGESVMVNISRAREARAVLPETEVEK